MSEPSAQGSLGAEAPAVVFVGCGRPTADAGAGAGAGAAVRAAGAAARGRGPCRRQVGRGGARRAGVCSPMASGSQRGAGQAVAEGAVLAAYRFVSHKSDDEGGGIERFVVAGAGLDAAELAEGTRRGVAVADAVCLARDLVNEPPSSMTPDALRRGGARARGGPPRGDRRGLGRAAHRRRAPGRAARAWPGARPSRPGC